MPESTANPNIDGVWGRSLGWRFSFLQWLKRGGKASQKSRFCVILALPAGPFLPFLTSSNRRFWPKTAFFENPLCSRKRISQSTASNIGLSEFFGPHRVLGRELSELRAAYYLCAEANSPSFFAELTELPPSSVSSLLSETVLSKEYSALLLIKAIWAGQCRGQARPLPGRNGTCPSDKEIRSSRDKPAAFCLITE